MCFVLKVIEVILQFVEAVLLYLIFTLIVIKTNDLSVIFLQEFQGTMKTGRDRIDYVLDRPIWASAVMFQILEYNDELNKCARVEVRGCVDTGGYFSRMCPFSLPSNPFFIFLHALQPSPPPPPLKKK